MKTALVLSGGSIKGCFQAGAMEALLAAGVRPAFTYGVSVGALNGAFIADRAGRRAQAPGGFDPAQHWSAIGRELTRFWTSRITSPGAIARKRPLTAVGASALFDQFDGLYDMRPLYRIVEEEVKPAHLVASPMRLSVGAVSVHTGRLHLVSEGSPGILDFIIASTAIPIMMPARVIGSEALVDGGLVDIAPLKQAIKAGAETVYCVTCQPRESSPAGPGFNHRKFAAYAERLFGLVTDEILRNDIELALKVNAFMPADGSVALSGPYAGKRRVRIVLVEPSAPLPISLDAFGPKDIEACIGLGRRAAEVALKG